MTNAGDRRWHVSRGARRYKLGRMSSVQVSTVDGVGHVVLDHPGALNALTPTILRALIAECDKIAADPSIRIVRLTGADGNFSAGADLPAFSEALQREAPSVIADLGRRAAVAVADLPQITVATVQGHCVGGGLVLASACDVRLAADDARFIIPELEAGIPLAWGAMERLVYLVGETVATDWVLTCRGFDAEEAHRAGLVTRILSSDGFGPEASGFVGQLARRPSVALRSTKRQLQQLRSGRFDPRTDADALLSAMADPEAAAIGQRYVQTKIRKKS